MSTKNRDHRSVDDATISSASSAAVSVVSADDVVISLEGDSFLSDTASYAEDADVNATLFSEADLTITGEGSLTVVGNGNDGIESSVGVFIDAGSRYEALSFATLDDPSCD